MVQAPSTSSKSSEEAAKQADDDKGIDNIKARKAVEAYLDILREKQSSIKKVIWAKVPEVSGDNYYFSCTVEYSGFVRKTVMEHLKPPVYIMMINSWRFLIYDQNTFCVPRQYLEDSRKRL